MEAGNGFFFIGLKMAKTKDVKIIADKICCSTSALLEILEVNESTLVRKSVVAGIQSKMFLIGETLHSRQ